MSCPDRRRVVSKGVGRILLTATATAGVWVWPEPAEARSWIAGSGSWSVAGNWAPVGVPLVGDDAHIVHNDAINRVITFDHSYPMPLGAFVIDQTGSGNTTFSMSGDILSTNSENIDKFQFIGMNGKGNFFQSGGTNTGGGSFAGFNQVHLGENAGSAGTYNLSGGTLISAGLLAGYSGSGTFIQTGGVASLSFVNFAINTGSSGTFLLSGTGSLYVGNSLWRAGRECDLQPDRRGVAVQPCSGLRRWDGDLQPLSRNVPCLQRVSGKWWVSRHPGRRCFQPDGRGRDG